MPSVIGRRAPIHRWRPYGCAIEEVFGWMKGIAGAGRSRMVGRWKLKQALELAAAAYNLVRLRKLAPAG